MRVKAKGSLDMGKGVGRAVRAYEERSQRKLPLGVPRIETDRLGVRPGGPRRLPFGR